MVPASPRGADMAGGFEERERSGDRPGDGPAVVEPPADPPSVADVVEANAELRMPEPRPVHPAVDLDALAGRAISPASCSQRAPKVGVHTPLLRQSAPAAYV